MRERWGIVQSHRNYAISDKGRVRNLNTGRLLKPQMAKRGGNYLFVNLYANGKRRNINVHILVASAFLVKPESGGYIATTWLVDHKDGNRQNPRLDNLEYVTPKENARRRELRKKVK
jgi:hypothetical protein